MKVTERLFEQDSLLEECTAKVLACEKKADRFEVILDRTVIFPEGGGQLSDQGWIDEAAVFHAEDRKPDIVHYTERQFAVGKEVVVRINKEIRLDHMQQHCGEHILSHAFWKLCGANNVGFHMNEDIVTVDLDKELTEEEINKCEDYANEQVWADLPVHVDYLSHENLAGLPLRKYNDKLRGIVRVVTVEGGDCCTCCGTHPPKTGMVGAIKIFKYERHKGGIRVEFGCGKRALLDARMRYKVANDIGNMLSVKVCDAPQSVIALKDEIAQLNSRVKERTLALYDFKVKEILGQAPVNKAGFKVVCLAEEIDPAGAKLLMQRLNEEIDLVVGIFSHNGDRINYQFSVLTGAEGDCRKYSAKANELLGAKGGGKPQFAQGGAPYSADWREKVEAIKEYMLTI